MKHKSYLVLARKYRPASFADLRGQEALATTLSNAIKFQRVAHAFLFTGIRGVGKTTSARILAKTLNCTDQQIREYVEPCGACSNCLSMQNENHPDILEIDAASKTGVNDAREIIENAKYLPILGQYKIYIIDEVHMLSTNAFNAFLKILEEPPEHVKFIFATTEVRKIPVTIISRCQRYDLRRLLNTEIIQHLNDVLAKENLSAEPDALAVIADNSEGSMRDSLSLLDQAIAYTPPGQAINSIVVRQMLGLTNNGKILALMDAILNGKIEQALAQAKELYLEGIEPLLIVDDLMKLIHLISKLKILPEFNEVSSYNVQEMARIKEIAHDFSFGSSTIIWQLLSRAVEEIKKANRSFITLEMLIIRICYQADLPNPLELKLEENNKNAKLIEEKKPVAASEKKIELKSFKEVVQLFQDHKEVVLQHYLCDEVELISFENNQILIKENQHLPSNFCGQIAKLLLDWTGQRWQIRFAELVAEAEIIPSLKQQQDIIDLKLKEQLSQEDAVREILQTFEGAEINKIIKAN